MTHPNPTRGPWHVQERVLVIGADYSVVAEARNEKDAALLAAAPVMLAALEGLILRTYNIENWTAAQAAIVLGRGGK